MPELPNGGLDHPQIKALRERLTKTTPAEPPRSLIRNENVPD
jgi:hypothetical protein